MGTVYRKDGKPIWMLKYYRNGRAIYESSGTAVKDDATTLLKKREGAIADGQPITNTVDRIRFDAAADDLITDYRVNRRRSLVTLERRIHKHLVPFFGGRKLSAITTPDVRAFVAHRQANGIVATRGRRQGERIGDVSNAEINRELAVLKRVFTLAMQAGLILHRPHIPMLAEDNVRAGFFELPQYERVRAHLPAPLDAIVTFAYITGWRIDSEVITLQWRNVDFAAGEIRLHAGRTKNRDGRVFKMTAVLRRVLERQRDEHVDLATRDVICPWVFFRMVAHGRGGEKHPRPIRRFNKVWVNACRAAGCPGKIPHDFRRTAVRNMVRAGIPERVAMKLTGHKTRSVFERYNIVSDGDLADAAAKLDGFDATRRASERG